ncbi:MAG: hypothetical protein PHE67_04290 [Campylobacterales bacterium]|nr:hypothetical protein [Campylobacterales bacterium]
MLNFIGIDFDKFPEVKSLKNYQLLFGRFEKKVLGGKEDALTFFKKNIIGSSEDVFKRRIRAFKYLLAWAYINKHISKETVVDVVELIDRKKEGKLREPGIDFRGFFKYYMGFKDIIIENITKEKSLGFILLPLLLCGTLTSFIRLRYCDIKIKKIEDALLLVFESEKNKYQVVVKKEVADFYLSIFKALESKYGEESSIFHDVQAQTWLLNSTSVYMYELYKEFITNGADVKDLMFSTLLKREIRSKGGQYFQEI